MAFSTGQGFQQEGFRELYDTIKRLDDDAGEFGVEYQFKRELLGIGGDVAALAPGFVTHKYANTGELEASVKVSATRAGVSVFSSSVYGGVQQYGGGPAKGWKARGPHVTRANASHWMSKAAKAGEAKTQTRLDALTERIAKEIENG